MKEFDNDIVLKIENLGKDYVLGTFTGETIKESIKSRRNANFEKKNSRYVALDGVNLEVKRGEAIGIIGSNGAGKSTLLKIISRITAPSRGKVYIDGKVSSMLEVGTGFHPDLTGRENIYLNGSILGMKREEIDSKIESIIEFSEIREFIDTPVKRYSSGMYVKLAFSVAAHLDSDIMIMDEVLAVGDIKFQHKCLAKMREIASTGGRTILYVSHNMETVQKLCDRCIVLEKGKLVFEGNVDEATRKYSGVVETQEDSLDFTEYMRPGWLGRDEVRLEKAWYTCEKDDINRGDFLSIGMRYKINNDVENVGVRVELVAAGEKPFATKTFYNVLSGTAGETGEFEVKVNLEHVMNGQYSTFYTLFCLDTNDETIDLDCVHGMNFEIQRQSSEGVLKWRNNSWGNISL